MSLFISGRVTWFIITLSFSIIMYLFLTLAKQHRYIPNIRMHPGINAMQEGIGRAVEEGKPVVFSPGGGQLYSANYAGDTAAALSLLEYVANMAISTGAVLIVTPRHTSILPVASDILRTAYMSAGIIDEYNENQTLRFYSQNQWGWASAFIGMLHRERPAAVFYFGAHAAEATPITESGATVGAIQVAGTTNVYQVPIYTATCDYVLMPEDEFAAAAYVSKDPVQKGVVLGQDISRIILMILLLLGSFLMTTGNDIIKTLLKR